MRAHQAPARQSMASAMTAKPLLRILDAPCSPWSAECNVNGQGARLKPGKDDARESGRKSDISTGGAIDARPLLAHEAGLMTLAWTRTFLWLTLAAALVAP